MLLKSIFYLFTINGLLFNAYSQVDLIEIEEGIDYDARLFMTRTQINLFNQLYPKFDTFESDENWEWNDVDPLELFTQEENRYSRRKLFLFEHNPNQIYDNNPFQEQLAFKILIQNQIKNSEVLIDKSNAKIILTYTKNYENLESDQMKNLLERISDLGLDWASAGGNNLYIYNGNILLGRYKLGYVNIALQHIDTPNIKYLSDFKD